MSTMHRIFKAGLDGTTGGTIDNSEGLGPELKWLQISIAGRTTGSIVVTAKADGGEDFEPFTGGGLTIDLASGEYTVFPIGSFEALKFTPSAPGSAFDVTIKQTAV